MTSPSTVRIALLLPDLLGTYGDRGNATVLARRPQWRGHRAEIIAGRHRLGAGHTAAAHGVGGDAHLELADRIEVQLQLLLLAGAQ